MNQVVVMGNLTRNVEVRKTKNGTSVANFTVVVNEDYTNKAGEKVKSSVGVPCESWGWVASQMDGLTTKDKIVVVGALKTEVKEEGGKPTLLLKATSVSVIPYKGKSLSNENLEVASVGVESSDDIPF